MTGPGKQLRAVRDLIGRGRTAAAASSVLRALTPLGWATAALAVLGLGGWLLGGFQEFQVLGGAALLPLLVATLFLIGRRKYLVELDLATERVTVGEPATGRLLVRNTASHRQGASRMELPIGRNVAQLRLPALDPGADHEDLFVIPTQRRAVIPVGPVRSISGDAVGLVRREVRWTDPQQIYVHPRVAALDGSAPGFLRDLEGQVTPDVTNSDVAFHALRSYVPGDDRRYIHWRTSARTGTLMVRQFEETRRSHLAVALSTLVADYADADQFELAVEVAASIGVQAFREERRLSVLTSTGAFALPTRRRMLDQFSGVDAATGRTGIVELARITARDVADASVAFLICGSEPSPQQIRSAGVAFDLGVRVLALRAVPGAKVAIRTLGGAAVITLGDLNDLPIVLRRVRSS